MIVADPEIKVFDIQKEHDFIVLGCDGIFDKLNNEETSQCVWNSVSNEPKDSVHTQCGVGVEYILKNSLLRKSLDNVTIVMIAFSSFKHQLLKY